MAITVVAQKGFIVSSAASGSVNEALPGTPAENDIVVVGLASDGRVRGDGSAGDGGIAPAAGYTTIIGSAGGTTPGYQWAWKRMGATPDTTVEILHSNGSAGGTQAGVIQLVRGVDATTALDVTSPAAATGASGNPDPPTITPVTDNALVMAFGALDDDPVESSAGAPTNYGDLSAKDSEQAAGSAATVFLASRTLATAAAEDPGAFTSDGSDQWAAGTAAFRPAAGGGNTTMVASKGAYAITGKTITTTKQWLLTAAKGAYAITGKAATTSKGFVMVAAKGAYVITGKTITTTKQWLLTAAKGTYTITGKTATLFRAITLVAAKGSYAITGKAITTTKQWLLTAAKGAYAITGKAATLTKSGGAITMVAAKGAYTITGKAAITTKQWLLTAVKGVYAITGKEPITSRDITLIAAKGAYAITGKAITTTKQWKMVAAAGVYAITGKTVTFLRTHIMVAAKGAYAITGNAITTTKQWLLVAAKGSYAVTGKTINTTKQWLLVVAKGAYAITGKEIITKKTILMVAAKGSYALTGKEPTFTSTETDGGRSWRRRAMSALIRSARRRK